MPTYTPKELAAVVKTRMSSIDDVELLTSRAHKRLLEMWCASRFALGYAQYYGHCKIEIEDTDEQREYDFHQWFSDDDRRPFQLTEVKDKSWPRSWEYRNLTKLEIEARYQKKGLMSEREGAERLREQLESKVDINYADSDTLNILLYANIPVPGLRWDTVRRELRALASRFASVWIVTEDMITCVHGPEFDDAFVGWKEISDDA